MYDVLGREVFSISFEKETNINVSEFTTGVYTLKLETGNNIETKKIVVNK
jgi:hypothetical protein